MIDVNKFNEVFKVDELNSTRRISTQDAIRVFPFTTNKDLVDDFYKVVGALLRNVEKVSSVKEDIKVSSVDELLLKFKSNIEGDVGDLELKQILKDLYFDEEGELRKELCSMLMYAGANSAISKTAQYIQDVLVGDKEEDLKTAKDAEVMSVIDKIFIGILPQLNKLEKEETKFYNFCPYITKEFQEDMDFIIKSKDFSIDDLVKLIELYYFIYTCQTLLKINHRTKGEKNQVEIVYFALDWEKVSHLRKCIDFGYKLIVASYDKAFSNVALLQLLNCDDGNENLDFSDIKHKYDLMSDADKKTYKESLLNVYEIYKDCIKPDSGKQFKDEINADNDLNDIIEVIHKYIYFQVCNSERKAPAGRYIKDFRDYTETNFVKFRGRLGQTLNITDDFLIFITKLAIKDNNRMRLVDVFKSFERKGVFFDEGTKETVVKFYERLNILEKKSDSGVVQYVKKI